MRKINLIFIIGLLLALNGCDESCCDSALGSKRPHFFYQDQEGNDLLNQETTNHYDWDSIHFTLIQMENEFDIIPRITGRDAQKYNPDEVYTGRNSLMITSYPTEYLVLENTETIIIHLNANESDTIIYDVFFPYEGATHTDYRNLTVNGTTHEPNEGGYITIVKNRK